MTVREAARLLGRSTSTVYRWLRKGHLEPFQQAGLVAQKQGRRWIIKEKAVDWHPQVNQKYARQDGKTPEDFQFEQWPVAAGSVHLRHIDHSQDEYYPAEIAAVYRCDLPADTPLDNQYVEDASAPQGWRRLPEPVGMCLSSLQFELRDAATGEVLDEDGRQPTVADAGKVKGLLGGGGPLWQRLTPEQEIQVRLVAFPMFYYLNEEGGAMAAYATGHQGYFKGKEVESEAVYTLSIDYDGNVFIDDQARPEPPQ